MAKVTPTTITGGHGAVNDLNGNFTLLANEFDNVLSLDGTTPNSMLASLDLNDNDIINVKSIDTDSLQIGGVGIVPSSTIGIPSASSVPFTPAGSISSIDVQSAIEELETEAASLDRVQTFVKRTTFGDYVVLNKSILTRIENLTSYTSPTNAYTINTGEGITGYVDGAVYTAVSLTNSQTGTGTLQIDSGPAVTIIVNGSSGLLNGDIQSQGIYDFRYSSFGNIFTLLNPSKVYHGALVTTPIDHPINTATWTALDMNSGSTIDHDTDSFVDKANNRFNIPTGISRVKLSFFVMFSGNGTGIRQVVIGENGFTNTDAITGLGVVTEYSPDTINPSMLIGTSSVFNHTTSSYYQLGLYQNSGGILSALGTSNSNRVRFSIEAWR